MAKTKWWLCDACGFSNHPRLPATYKDEFINEKCEQCGAACELGLDFTPQGAA